MFFSLLLSFFISPPCFSETSVIYTLNAKNKYERSELAQLGYALENITESTVDIFGSEKDFKILEKTGCIKSFQNISPLSPLDFPGKDEQFHNYDELIKTLEDLAMKNPDLMELGDIGTSLEGRKIIHVVLSKNPKNSANKPALALLGGHHAREHISIELPLNLLETLIQRYRNNDSEVTRLLEVRAIHIIPMVNPDGAEYDISEDNYKFWRKNRKIMSSAVGVDLNRNYDYAWGTTGTSQNPRSDVYCGPSPFSEPETQAIKGFIESHLNISILVSFHTYSELILYPWGHTYNPIANEKDLLVHKTMAEKMAEWNGYTPEQSSDLYAASGDTTDWTYGVHGIFSFTFELDPKNGWDGGFYPGQSYIPRVLQKNINPILYLADLTDNPYRVLQPQVGQYGLSTPLLK